MKGSSARIDTGDEGREVIVQHWSLGNCIPGVIGRHFHIKGMCLYCKGSDACVGSKQPHLRHLKD